MHKLALLLLLSCGAGLAQAQPLEPMSSLDATVAELRAQANGVAQLLVGQRLNQPERLHDIAALFDGLSVISNTLATHAEHGQITTAQRQALQDQVAKIRVMLESLNAQLRASGPP